MKFTATLTILSAIGQASAFRYRFCAFANPGTLNTTNMIARRWRKLQPQCGGFEDLSPE